MTDRRPRLPARFRRDGGRLASSLRRLAVGVVAASALVAGAAPAQAAVTSAVAGGELTARSNAGDAMAITCAPDGSVRVNGARPRTGSATCSSITSISVDGGPASNGVDLSAVARTRFTRLGNGRVGIRGGGGDDVLVGSAFADRIAGDEGNDFLDGDTGGDRLEGGVGHDRLLGFDGADKLFGGEGSDRLEAEEGADSLEGQGGDDTLLGGDDDDSSLNGNGGNDTIGGGGGNDKLFGEADSDELAGDAGDDELTGDLAFSTSLAGDDDLDGGDGKDRVLEGVDEDFTLTNDGLRGLGTDTLRGVEAAVLMGGSSSNTIDASKFSGPVTLFGSDGDDTLIGGPANDVVGSNESSSSEKGNDTLTGGGGDDAFYGGEDADSVVETGDRDFTVAGTTVNGTLAGLGDDKLEAVETADLTGGAGANTLDASAFSGKAVLDGEAGGDRLTGGAGGDRLTGGADDDTLAGNDGLDLVDESGDVDFTLTDTELLGRGKDELGGIEEADLTGGAGANTLDASAFSGKAVLDGEAGGDRLTGGAGDDTLAGGDGGDGLVGSGGNDTETGGPGGDALAGGPGKDTLTGDAGVDAFWGDAGDDVLRTRDQTAESSIACGSDSDTVSADLEDMVSADCERVNRPLRPRASRSVSLRAAPTQTQSGGSARLSGRILARTDPVGCGANQVVALQRARPGTRRFGTFKRVRTNGASAFDLRTRVTRTYLYRALVYETSSCFGAVSRGQRVRVIGG
jgi:Ca2+-binding RTX toxin-like protein